MSTEEPRGIGIREIAIHEAGHAVAHYVLRMPFTSVDIIPNEEAERLGVIDAPLPDEDPQGRWLDDRNWIERRIMCDYAGFAAQHQAGFTDAELRGPDESNAHVLAESIAPYEHEELDCYLSWLWARTQNLIASPENWAAVEALATALVERRRIGAREARRIIRNARETVGGQQ